MYARWKNRSGGWTKLFIMIKAFEVSCPILKDVFPEHKTLKNSLYDKIKNTKDVGWFNHKDGYNDRIHRTDWPIADNFKREKAEAAKKGLKQFAFDGKVYPTGLTEAKIKQQQKESKKVSEKRAKQQEENLGGNINQ